jgi:hypothetical protein
MKSFSDFDKNFSYLRGKSYNQLPIFSIKFLAFKIWISFHLLKQTRADQQRNQSQRSISALPLQIVETLPS